ncbi:TPA: conjugal transfer protein [Serratia marcescens]|nr:conjugal transfer protein [Serratia marcescens]
MMTRLYCAVYALALTVSETLRRLTLRALTAWLALISPMAMADGDIADMFNSVSQGATSGTKSVLNIALFAGVCGVIGSIFAAKSMKNNPQIKLWMVLSGFVLSILLIVIPELIRRGQTQVGMTPVSVG